MKIFVGTNLIKNEEPANFNLKKTYKLLNWSYTQVILMVNNFSKFSDYTQFYKQ